MKRPRYRVNRIFMAMLPAALFFLCQNPALAKCANDWLSIDEIRNGDSVELRATNYQEYPITYSVRVYTGRKSRGKPRMVRSDTLEGQETQRVMVPNDGGEISNDDIRIRCSWTIGSKDATHDNDHLYLLPYASGMSYRVLQGFGSRFSHRGVEQFAVDFNMPVGTPVHAARGGTIVRVEESNDKGCWEDGCGAYANFIVVMHDDGTTGEYYHLAKDGALVEVGDRVFAGQKIALSGNTGHTALPHLHFAVYRATTSARSQSIPISFISSDGIVYKPRRGQHYLAVARQNAGD